MSERPLSPRPSRYPPRRLTKTDKLHTIPEDEATCFSTNAYLENKIDKLLRVVEGLGNKVKTLESRVAELERNNNKI